MRFNRKFECIYRISSNIVFPSRISHSFIIPQSKLFQNSINLPADTFCMTVYDCKVSDGASDVIQLLDQDGCALDQHLLGNLEYPADLMAGVEAHVFKYADRSNLYFNCQINILVKDPGSECSVSFRQQLLIFLILTVDVEVIKKVMFFNILAENSKYLDVTEYTW